jgi:predicted DNA-binding protein YlxM (UPF0122 family)
MNRKEFLLEQLGRIHRDMDYKATNLLIRKKQMHRLMRLMYSEKISVGAMAAVTGYSRSAIYNVLNNH